MTTLKALPTLLDLREAADAMNGHVTVGALRAAVKRGELIAIRTSDSCSAKILIDADDLAAWLRVKCAGRNIVPSPSEVSRALRASDPDAC